MANGAHSPPLLNVRNITLTSGATITRSMRQPMPAMCGATGPRGSLKLCTSMRRKRSLRPCLERDCTHPLYSPKPIALLAGFGAAKYFGLLHMLQEYKPSAGLEYTPDFPKGLDLICYRAQYRRRNDDIRGVVPQ